VLQVPGNRRGICVTTKVPGLMFCSPPLAMSTQSRVENIAHTAMYTYKGGELNISPGTFVGGNRSIVHDEACYARFGKRRCDVAILSHVAFLEAFKRE